MAKKKTPLNYTGKDLEHYNALVEAWNQVSSSIKLRAGEVLDRSGADKRGVTTHMADVSSDTASHEIGLRQLSEDGDVLDLIEDAFERLARGDYGKCQDCGEMISEARLKVRPYAVFCIKCKTKREEMER
ncbi:MAG: TraR/DksA family transcriptional regulator [Lentisphaeria bacterium]|jgi:DnaK suppressor protein|nr:TraR/DksA family transcriptional regulator [Lentisphaeria bacterium]